jgi:hypothetical protein
MIAIFAIVCSLASGNCTRHTITNSDVEPGLSMSSCYDIPKIAQWFTQNFPTGYTMKSFGCQIGDRGRVA